MDTKNIIPVSKLCVQYQLPDDFFDALQRYELIETVEQSNEVFIRESEIGKLEKAIRLHYELDINFEGLDVIFNLLEQIADLQQEVNQLRNKLAFYTSV